MHFSLNNFKIGICFVGGTTMGKLCQICNLSFCPLSHLTWPRVARMDHLFRSHPPQWMLARDNENWIGQKLVKCGKVTFTVLSTRDREGEERRRWRRNAQELKQTWIFSPPGVIQVAFKAAHKERGGEGMRRNWKSLSCGPWTRTPREWSGWH